MTTLVLDASASVELLLDTTTGRTLQKLLLMQMATSPVRVPDVVHTEVQAAARLLGCNAAELLERAWSVYRETPEFCEDFENAQKALAAGNLDAVVSRLRERADDRARRRANAVRALRNE